MGDGILAGMSRSPFQLWTQLVFGLCLMALSCAAWFFEGGRNASRLGVVFLTAFGAVFVVWAAVALWI
jgi:hypothetical protein